MGSFRKSVVDLSQVPSDSSQQSKDKKPMISCHCPPSNLVGGQTVDGQTTEKKGEKKKVKKLTKYDCKTVDITPFFIYLLTLHLNQAESQELSTDGSLKNCCQTSNFLLKKIIDKVAMVTQVPMGACGNCFNQECVDKNHLGTCCQCNGKNHSATCCQCNKPKNDAKSCQCNDMPTHENCFKEFDQKYGPFYNKLSGFLEAVKSNEENYQHAEPDLYPNAVKSYSNCQCRNKRGRGAGENILEKCISKSPRRTKFSDDRFNFQDRQSVPDYDNHESGPIANEDELKKIIDRIIRDTANENKMKEKLSQNSIDNVESTETVKKSETSLKGKEAQNKHLTNEDVESLIKKEMEKYFQKYYDELHKNNCVCNTNKEPSKPFEMTNICNNRTAQVSHRTEENQCKFQNDHPPPILGTCLKCGCLPGEKSNNKTKSCIQRVPSDVMFFLQEEAPTKKAKKEGPIKKNIKQEKKETPKMVTRPNIDPYQDDVRICHEKHKDLSMSTPYENTKERVCICSDERVKDRTKMRKINNMKCYVSDDMTNAREECSKINRGSSPICSEIYQDKIENKICIEPSPLKCICNTSQQKSLVPEKKVENILPKEPENIIQINEAPKETELPFTKTESSKCQKQILFEDSSPIGWEPMVVQDSYQKTYSRETQRKVSQISEEPTKKQSEVSIEKCKPVELTHSYHQGVHKFTCVEPKVTKTGDVKPKRIYNKGTQNENEQYVYTPNTCRTYNKGTQLKNTESKTGPVCKDTSYKYREPVTYEDNQKSKTVCKDREKKSDHYEKNYDRQTTAYNKGDLSEVEESSEEEDEELWSHPNRKYKGGNYYIQNKRHTKSVSMKRDIKQKKDFEQKALEEQLNTSFRAKKYKKPDVPSNLRPIIPPKTISKRTPELNSKGTTDNLYTDQKQEELDDIRAKYYKRHAKCFQNADYSKNKLGLGTRNINLDQSEYKQSYSEGESYGTNKKIYNQYNVSIHKKPIYFSYESQIEQNPKWRAVDDVISGNDVELEPNLTSSSYDCTNDENIPENYEPYDKDNSEIYFDKNSSDEQVRSTPQKNRPKFGDPRVQRTDKRVNPVLIELSNEFEQEGENVEDLSDIKSAEIEESTTSSSEKLSVFNRPLSPIPEAECENSSGSNSVKNEAPREINAVKRFFSFSRKKDESEQQSKRKTIKEFILGIKKDIARKKSLAQKQDENES